ncbi:MULTISPECIES: RNase adapter RapZ [Actinoalloteichus]|nr:MULTISPECIES: RNase adapter RapZ [Actinoalloteichus]
MGCRDCQFYTGPGIVQSGRRFAFGARIMAAQARDSRAVHIAVGCTGGWHRSPAVVLLLADLLGAAHPRCTLTITHRDLTRCGIGVSAV